MQRGPSNHWLTQLNNRKYILIGKNIRIYYILLELHIPLQLEENTKGNELNKLIVTEQHMQQIEEQLIRKENTW